MLQKTKLTLLRVFAIVAFVALFVVASISLASCSSDPTVVSVYTENGTLYAKYSDGTIDELGELTGSSTSSVTVQDVALNGNSLVITYSDGSTSPVDLSGIVATDCDHKYEVLPYGTASDGVIQVKDCGHVGLTLEYCTICGNVIVDIDDDLDAHTLNYSTLNIQFDSNYEATATVTCDVCGLDVEVDAVVTSETTAATCTADGSIAYTATVTDDAGTTYTESATQILPATGHSYSGHTIVIDTGAIAYVYIDGSTTPATYTDLVAVFGADHVKSADCEEAGAYIYSQGDSIVCATCGEALHGVTDTFDHNEGTPVQENVVAADCENDGSYDTVVYCTVCGKELDRETTTVPATGHAYAIVDEETDWVWTDGTTEACSLTLTCSICGDVNTVTATVIERTELATTYSCTTDESKTYYATYTDSVTGTVYTSPDHVYIITAASHVTSAGTHFSLDESDYIYIGDSTTVATVDEFVALGGTITKNECTSSIAYGTIYCEQCGKTLSVVIASTAEAHTFVEGGDVTSYEWAADYSYVALTQKCSVCGQYAVNQIATTKTGTTEQDGYYYAVTYGGVTYTSETFYTVTMTSGSASGTAALTSTAASANYQTTTATQGYYAITFSSTEAYITVTSAYGSYTSYTEAAAVALSAKALESTADVAYLLDASGNPALVPAGADVFITITLYDATSSASVDFAVAEAADPVMTVGETFSVSLGTDELYSYSTTITITEAGYYTVTLSGSDYAYVIIWDDANKYYYSTNWVNNGWITLGYIVDYANSDEVPISIPANTTLNVAITYSSDELTAISVLIAKGDYTPATSGDDEGGDEETNKINASTSGLEFTLSGEESISIYVEATGTYTFYCEDYNGVDVSHYAYDSYYEIWGSEHSIDNVYSGSSDLYLMAGDTIVLTLCKTTDSNISITITAKDVETSGDSGDEGDGEDTSTITYSYNFSNIFTADDQNSLSGNMTGTGSDADTVFYFTESGYTTTADESTDYVLTYSTHKYNDKIANTSVYYNDGAYVTSVDEGVTADVTYSYAIQPNGPTTASNQRYFTIDLSEYAGKTVTIEIVGTSKTGCCYMLTTAGVSSVDTEAALASNTVATSDYATVDVVTYTGTVTESGLYYITFYSNSSRIYAINITITDAE